MGHNWWSMAGGGQLRVRALLERWFGIAVVTLLVVGAVGAILTYGAYVEPGTHQEERVVDEWGVDGSFSHRAVVTGPANGTPFEAGAVVRNRSVYFRRIMPVLEGEFALATPGADRPVDLTVDRRLVVRSIDVATGTQEPTVYWRETVDLGRNATTNEPGTTATVPFRVNVNRTVLEARNVSERLRSPGRIEAEIVVSVLATRRTDDAVTERIRFTLPVRPEEGIYHVESGARTETFSETRLVAVRNEPGPLRRVGGPVLLVVGLVGATGLLLARWRDAIALSEAEREWLAYRDDRTDFDQWISTVRLPQEARTLPVAEAETLADLVDFAIDADAPVIESPNGKAYHVVHDGYRYTFEAPPEPVPGSAQLAEEGPAGSESDATGDEEATTPD